MSRNRRKRAGDLSSRGAQKRQLTRLYEKYEGICQLCFTFCSEDQASRDHVIELCLGGSSSDDNMVLAHKDCNNAKSKEVSQSLNPQSKLSEIAEDLPDSWWDSLIARQIKSAMARNVRGIPVLPSPVPSRLKADKNFYCSLI